MTDETKGRIWYTAVFLLAAFYVVCLGESVDRILI